MQKTRKGNGRWARDGGGTADLRCVMHGADGGTKSNKKLMQGGGGNEGGKKKKKKGGDGGGGKGNLNPIFEEYFP